MQYKFSLDEAVLLQHALVAFQEYLQEETDQEYEDQYSRNRTADIKLLGQISNRLIGEDSQ